MTAKESRASVVIDKPNSLCTAATLGEILGITDRRVRQLTHEGVLTVARTKLSGMHYRLADSVKSFQKNQRESLIKQYGSTNAEYESARTRQMVANAEREEIRTKQIKGEVYHGADVEFVIVNILTYVKQGVRAIPAKTSRKLIGKKNFKEVHDILSTEIDGVLDRLSTPDKETFRQLSAARLAKQGVNLEGVNGKDNHRAKTVPKHSGTES